jgi:ABC-2 type transport system permease protein
MVALETLGKDVFRLGAVCVPVYLLFLASGTILPPASSAHALAFLAAIGLGWTILFGVCYLSGLASFFTKAGWGFVEMQIAVIMFFAGTAVPLAMYPTWLQQVAAVLPFKAIYYMPINVYLGKVALESVPGILVSQALWAAALAACGRLIWRAAAKRLTVQGG